jgi:hypothetical protein
LLLYPSFSYFHLSVHISICDNLIGTWEYCPIRGKAWVQCTGALDPLGFCHVFSFVQFLYTWQHFNGSSATVHWTKAIPSHRVRLGSSAQEHWTRWDSTTCLVLYSFYTRTSISTDPILLCTEPKPFPPIEDAK